MVVVREEQESEKRAGEWERSRRVGKEQENGRRVRKEQVRICMPLNEHAFSLSASQRVSISVWGMFECVCVCFECFVCTHAHFYDWVRLDD